MNPNKMKSVLNPTAAFGSLAATARWVVILSGALLLVGPVGAVERPFQGRIDGQFVAAPTQDPKVYVGGAQAVGKATHVGAFTKVTSDVSDLTTGAVTGSFTMTAANGDHVTGVFAGFIVFGSAPGTFSWVLQATITGGSGRFSGATGEFVFVAEGALVITDGVVYGKYTEAFDGTIDY